MKRPDLTFISQNKFSQKDVMNDIYVVDKNNEIVVDVFQNQFKNAITQLPELVQIAESMYDSNPKSMMGIQILEILNKIKQ